MRKKPTILFIGDSICLGYLPLVQQLLSDQITISGIPVTAGDSSHVLNNIDEWMLKPGIDWIHFNCGLHDLKFFPDTKSYQQPLEVFESNLRKIVEILQRKKKFLVWATITPVIDTRHNIIKNFDRYERDVISYNRRAAIIMTAAGILINDLHGAIIDEDINTCLMDDGVHLTDHGNRLLSEVISRFIVGGGGVP